MLTEMQNCPALSFKHYLFTLSTGYPQAASIHRLSTKQLDNELWTTHFALCISSYPHWSERYPHASEACVEALQAIFFSTLISVLPGLRKRLVDVFFTLLQRADLA